jgi:hypothetical protein
MGHGKLTSYDILQAYKGLEKFSKQGFFRLTTFFFRNKKFLYKEQLLFSFLCIVKQKKIWSDPKIFENFYF